MEHNRAHFEHIWLTVERDRDGQRALSALRRDGFRPNWPIAILATIPVLPRQRSRSYSMGVPKGALRTVIRFLRDLSEEQSFGGVDFALADTGKIYPWYLGPIPAPGDLANQLEEGFLGVRYVAIRCQDQNHMIAVLLREVKKSTKKWHYRDVIDLLDAIFRASGKRFDMSEDSLRKVVRRDSDIHKAAHRKLLEQIRRISPGIS